MNKALFLFLSFVPFFLNAQNNLQNDFSGLINTELSFSNLSENKGIKEAFLFFLDDSAVIFRPTPKNGKEVYRNRKDIPGKLIWRPEYADISSSGNFGYTTGPWEFSLDSVKEYGHFVTVWHKIDQNHWRVLIDAGISHKTSSLKNIQSPILDESNINKIIFDSASSSSDLINLDRSLSYSKIKPNGFSRYLNLISKKARFNFPQSYPLTNIDSIKYYIASIQESMNSIPEKSIVSEAGDIGYTYGILETINNLTDQKFSYLRIWKKENTDWSLVLEVRNLIKE